MTLLHDHFHLRNQQAFQRLLDGSADRGQPGSGLSGSGGKSWTRPSPLTSGNVFDVNARDWLGRTVLHLACASTDGIEYVRLLLRHPSINVNLTDTESHWTPLHRALYNANIPTALLLLQRSDTDRTLQDLEGYTAFDLYNSTLNGTKPSPDKPYAELYTWGTNRNAALGLGDGGDRVHPDQVVIQQKDDALGLGKRNLVSRFSPILVRQIQMSKLHTAVITSESGGNLRLCGFGSGGRLGPGQHTQYSLKPLPQLSHTITSVALGQDHTLALTKSGEVLSWGLNRFSQLGYVVDTPSAGEGFSRTEEPIQAIPRKIQGPLRKEIVKGVAASKGASACWTDEDVYTWGTNSGQLGYDKAAQPVQILPRKATKVSQPVVAISITESAMACLLVSQDVICIWNDRHVKIMFPGHAFPTEMQPYRPPQAIQDAKIAKITSCEDSFAALSFNGELFTFFPPNPTEAGAASGKERSGFKPQRVWALRKKFSAVKDVALGSDGSIIVCTESGHVFIRSRNTKAGQSTSGKAFKFQRVSYLQRVTRVCANSTGAFGALRVEHQPMPIDVFGNNLSQDLADVQPYLRAYFDDSQQQPCYPARKTLLETTHMMHDDDPDDVLVVRDVQKLSDLLSVLDRRNKLTSFPPLSDESCLPQGADVLIHLPSGAPFPAHRAILGARSHLLSDVLNGSTSVRGKQSKVSLHRLELTSTIKSQQLIHLAVAGCHATSLLILLAFLYSDDILAIWDHRVATALEQRFKALKIVPAQIKAEVSSLAELLELPTLVSALDSPVKRFPAPTLGTAMGNLFQSCQKSDNSGLPRSVLSPDVVLQLADRDVRCHSVVLRARSLFFASFFGEEDWTVKRWDANGVIAVDMKHLDWRVMDYVLRFMCCGEEDLFDTLDFIESVDELLEFMFDVMAAANELLLDRLILLCSSVILQYTNIQNACYVLADATYLHAQQLTERIQSLIAVNMELFLDSGMLDDIPISLVKELAQFIRAKQEEKSPISRSGRLTNEAMEKHADWLALQDIPTTIPRSNHVALRKGSANLQLSPSNKKTPRLGPSSSPHPSPSIRPQRVIRRPPSGDDIFAMDDADVPVSLSTEQLPQASLSLPKTQNIGVVSSSPVWKAPSIPRVDMKAVMAETANETAPRRSREGPPVPSPQPSESYRSPQPDLRRSVRPAESAASPFASYPAPSSPGWRPTVDQSASRPSPPVTPSRPTIATGNGSSPSARPSPSTPRRPSGPPAIPGLGPVITPTKQAPSSSSTPGPSTIRRTSNSNKAWTQSQTLAFPSPPTTGMSFIAIQQLELDQVAGGSGKDKRSLREIQEEEQALQEEADFLTWWTAEEERIKLEAQLAAAMVQSGEREKPARRRPRKKLDREQTQTQTSGQGAQGGQGTNKRRPRKPAEKGNPPA
ncbi:BTB/POZ domain-containing protein 1 [Hypsizygus marmoreus]|uniref:BTB/POZ domain-containing protein 1 n=1 Tax=Hypsizygus marmoreus TaxID=39966 RepID=A0A369JWB7_HYPMA|nr:BTB/POZ domain-containing protein 1 [Hypsizygus marmoreus]